MSSRSWWFYGILSEIYIHTYIHIKIYIDYSVYVGNILLASALIKILTFSLWDYSGISSTIRQNLDYQKPFMIMHVES